ncbi:alpha/beta hydrolase [Raineyella fluvialis]|uniref:Esterase n=1 Tax=Raineyella fluvialis TaxID=2662261 RepID=A0A5Q2FA44_9ACTN|nr:alpha/beta hydrolase-fold protein [Raineyella fluvialis]QGF23840.1 hypothetical protein Rai3103_09310 [Raineyella fluvialis]
MFSLTSPWLIALIGLLLAVVLGWAIGWVPRQRAGVWRAVLTQVIALGGSITLSLLLIGLALNKNNGWYTTWADAFGFTSATSVTHASRGANDKGVTAAPEAIGNATALQADPAHNPALPGYSADASGGQYLSVTISGSTSGISQMALVWLPPSYQSHPNRFYPVLFGFTGSPGSPLTYKDKLNVGNMISSLQGDKQLREAIVVVPTTFPGNNDTECTNFSQGSDQAQWETFIDSDVRNWALTNLRAETTADAWATVGYSAGGYCAPMLAVRHPDHYARAIAMSGYFAPEWGKGPQHRPVNDPTYDLSAVVKSTKPKVDIWAYAARDDKTSMTALTEFQKAVHVPTTLTTTLQESGGHQWGVWMQGLPAGLQWLGQVSPAFAWRAS